MSSEERPTVEGLMKELEAARSSLVYHNISVAEGHLDEAMRQLEVMQRLVDHAKKQLGGCPRMKEGGRQQELLVNVREIAAEMGFSRELKKGATDALVAEAGRRCSQQLDANQGPDECARRAVVITQTVIREAADRGEIELGEVC